MEQKFNLFGGSIGNTFEVASEKEKQAKDTTIVCEAIQILRVVKSVMGSRRECIDTIKIDGAKMTYERALKIAKMKAEKIGNCMVVEKLERLVECY